MKPSSSCPKCLESTDVRPKMLLLLESARCACVVGLERLTPEFIQEGALRQFVQGLYCDHCGVGFLPDEMVKPSPQAWQLSKEGWRPVNADGGLGPPRRLPK